MNLWHRHLDWINFDGFTPQKDNNLRVGRVTAIFTLILAACLLVAFVTLLFVKGFLPRRNIQIPAKAQMAGIKIAIRGYETEYYKQLPAVLGINEGVLTPVEGEVLEILMGLSEKHNAHRIRFFDPPKARSKRGGIYQDGSGQWQLRDAWGQRFCLVYDADGDNRISHPSQPGEVIVDQTYLLISGGMDGKVDEVRDNLYSWQ